MITQIPDTRNGIWARCGGERFRSFSLTLSCCTPMFCAFFGMLCSRLTSTLNLNMVPLNVQIGFNDNLLQQKHAIATLESQEQESTLSLFSELSKEECKASVS